MLCLPSNCCSKEQENQKHVSDRFIRNVGLSSLFLLHSLTSAAGSTRRAQHRASCMSAPLHSPRATHYYRPWQMCTRNTAVIRLNPRARKALRQWCFYACVKICIIKCYYYMYLIVLATSSSYLFYLKLAGIISLIKSSRSNSRPIAYYG